MTMSTLNERKLPPRRIGLSSAWLVTALSAALVFAAALLTRTGVLDLPPIYDELYHLVPAMSWQTSGTLEVLDGSYERGAIFTRLVALGFALAGEQSTAAARLLPSAIPGALLVTVMFLWVRHVADRPAAWITLFFLLFWPNGIEVSQYIRFYALHGLVFLVAALALYGAATAAISTSARIGLCALAVPLLLLALKLQLTTVIGIGAIGLWSALVYGPGWLRRHRWLRWALLAAAAGVVLIAASGAADELLAKYWRIYRWEPWPVQRDTTFYHRDFRDNYPTFWPLFPIAAIAALRARFLPASFAVTLFSVCFVLQSFGGLKNIRYLYPVMPFFFAIWGIVLSFYGGRALRRLRGALLELFPHRWSVPLRTGAAVLAIAASSLFVAGANTGFSRGLKLALGSETQMLLGKRRWEWPDARAQLQPWLEKRAVVVTTEELLAVQWLGDYDFALNRPRFSEMLFSLGPDTQPFVRDFRNGRPLAGLVSDFEPVLHCAPVGVLISNASFLSTGLAREFAALARAQGATISTEQSGSSALLAWERAGDPSGTAGCLEDAGIFYPDAATALLSGTRQPQSVSSASAER